jgi:S1-C subfamily serine protease
MGRARILTRAAELLLVAVTGGALALGGAAVLGKLGSTTVEVQQVEQPAGQVSADTGSQAGGKSIAEIYRQSAPGVVQITSTSVVNVPSDPFFGDVFPPQRQEQTALGSGFVIDEEGHVVTNYHVVQGAKTVKVSFSNSEQVPATVVGSDPSTDLAVLQVHVDRKALHPLTLATLEPRPGRRPGRRDRQPVRPDADRHLRDRERARPADRGAEPLHDRPRDPDRRRAQPR